MRVRRCTHFLKIGETTFKCQLDKHADSTHLEEGYVSMRGGTVRKYTIKWTDEGFKEVRIDDSGPLSPTGRKLYKER